AENETKGIFAFALARTPPLAAARVRPRKNIALDELLVSRLHHVARAALAPKARLIHAIDRDADLAAFQDILDVPVLRRFLHRPLNQRLGPTQKALAILERFATRIQPPVDNVNGHVSSASACLFYAHVPLDQPADLPLGVAALDHARDEVVMLLLGLAVLLRAEGNHVQQILDLGDYPLLD